MAVSALERILPDEAATAEFGEDVAAALRAGDVILLEGELGAGKTTLARALLRALADDPELEVPSPTFTMVQSYATRVPANSRFNIAVDTMTWLDPRLASTAVALSSRHLIRTHSRRRMTMIGRITLWYS